MEGSAKLWEVDTPGSTLHKEFGVVEQEVAFAASIVEMKKVEQRSILGSVYRHLRIPRKPH